MYLTNKNRRPNRSINNKFSSHLPQVLVLIVFWEYVRSVCITQVTFDSLQLMLENPTLPSIASQHEKVFR